MPFFGVFFQILPDAQKICLKPKLDRLKLAETWNDQFLMKFERIKFYISYLKSVFTLKINSLFDSLV